MSGPVGFRPAAAGEGSARAAATVVNRRLFARIQARASAIEEQRGGTKRRRQLLAGLRGRVVEVGAGSGVAFAHYPTSVQEVVAVEPEPILRRHALQAARRASVPVKVVDGLAEQLPIADASVDATVLAGVLCSVPDPARALHEVARVLRPGGELRFYEHVLARNDRLARLQRLLDTTLWPRLFGGCHTSRGTEATLIAAARRLPPRAPDDDGLPIPQAAASAGGARRGRSHRDRRPADPEAVGGLGATGPLRARARV